MLAYHSYMKLSTIIGYDMVFAPFHLCLISLLVLANHMGLIVLANNLLMQEHI